MRCVVTGAAGFIGSSICDALLQRGDEVLGIDCFIDYYPREIKESNLAQARQQQKFSFCEANLLELDLEKTLEGADIIFHQAAQAGVRASWGEDFRIYTDNNILATQRLLEAAKSPRVRENLKAFVNASSSSVYGTAEQFPTSEALLPNPVSPYGVSKLAAERLAVVYSQEFAVPTLSLRYFTVYGPRQRPDMAFNRFIRAALLKEELTLYGDGDQTRDFTFIADAVQANLAAAQCNINGSGLGAVCNIGGGSRVSVNQVLAMLESIIGRPLKIRRDERQRGDARHTSADTREAQRLFDYQPRVALQAGLEAEVRWLEESLRQR